MKFPWLLFFTILPLCVSAQHDLYVGTSFMGGLPSNQYEKSRNEMYSRKVSNVLNGSLFFQYRFLNRIGLEVGASQQVMHLRLQDKNFATRNPGFQVRLSSNNFYWSTYAALFYTQPISLKSHLYTSIGVSMNNIGNAAISNAKTFIVSGETVTFKNSYNSNNSVYLEAGFESRVSKRINLFIGFRFNNGLKSMAEGEYISEKDGMILSQDHYKSNGTFFGLNAGLKINVIHKEKKQIHIKPIEPPIATVPSAVVPKTPKEVEGRALIVAHKLIVKNKNVTVYVWDDQKVDGDRISLNLNGQWIIQDYTLEKAKKSFVVTLNPGENIFVLHALNLGKIKPNTAALLVDDGVSNQQLLLESDMKSSGTVILQYEK